MFPYPVRGSSGRPIRPVAPARGKDEREGEDDRDPRAQLVGLPPAATGRRSSRGYAAPLRALGDRGPRPICARING